MKVCKKFEPNFASGFGTDPYECKHSNTSDNTNLLQILPDPDFNDEFWTDLKDMMIKGVQTPLFQQIHVLQDHDSKINIQNILEQDLTQISEFLSIQNGSPNQSKGVISIIFPQFKYEAFGCTPLSIEIQGSAQNPYPLITTIYSAYKIKKDESNQIPQIITPNYTYIKTPQIKFYLGTEELKIEQFSIHFKLDYERFMHFGGAITIPKSKSISISLLTNEYDNNIYQTYGKSGTFKIQFNNKILQLTDSKLIPQKKPYGSSNNHFIKHTIAAETGKSEVILT